MIIIVIILIADDDENDEGNDNSLKYILYTLECPFFQKRNVQAILLNEEVTHALVYAITHYNL